MPRNIRWDESVKENTLCLVEALLLHADDEFKDEELKTVVYVEWVTENKLHVTGKKVKQISGKRSRTDEVGTRKEHLLKLVTKAGKSLKLPQRKKESGSSQQERQLEEVQYVLDSLRELGLLEEDDNNTKKNQGYWKFTLTLEHQTKREENLELVKQKWKEHPKTNSPEVSPTAPTIDKNVSVSHPENLPRSGVAKFVGRDEKLEQLHALLQQGDRVAISAIAGMSGVGKTELAIQYAKQYQESYPGGICWLFAWDNVGTQVVGFAQTYLGLKIPDGLELPDQVAFCWRNWLLGNMLVVLDDVAKYRDVEPYLPPQAQHFKVLMTTRLKFGAPIRTLPLEVLTLETSLELLESLINKERIEQELEIANTLCEWLGYLPLGLELVGRYLEQQPDLSLSVMLFRLKEKAKKNQALKHRSLVRDPDDPTWTLTAQRGVEAAFDLSWEVLNDQSQHLGKLLSLFAPAPIPWELVAQAKQTHCEMYPAQGKFDPEELEDARAELIRFHLLQNLDLQTYRLHSLIREFFRGKLEGEEYAAAS